MAASVSGAAAAALAAPSSSSSSSSAYHVYEAAYATDARTLLSLLDTYLPLSFHSHDQERVQFYLRRLVLLTGLKTAVLTAEGKARFIRLLVEQLLQQAERETLPLTLQVKMMETICSLLRHEKELPLAFDWKRFYRFLAAYHLSPSHRGQSTYTGDMLYAHHTHITKTIAKLRRYFVGGGAEEQASTSVLDVGGFAPSSLSVGSRPALSAGEEVLNTFIPFMCPFDNMYFRSQALLCLFFPSHIRQQVSLSESATPGATRGSFLHFLKLYTPFTHNLIDLCPLTIVLNMQVYARMAKHALGVTLDADGAGGVELMAPFVCQFARSFFSTFLQTLELNIGNKHSQNMHRHWTHHTELVFGTQNPATLDDLSDYFAKFVVYTLHYGQKKKEGEQENEFAVDNMLEGLGDGKSVSSLLTSLLFTLRNYFHPSHSSGKLALILATFLVRLVEGYCKRLGREIRGEAPYDRRYYLDPSNLDLVLGVQSLAQMGLYSKSHAMVSACEQCLRHLATFYPQHILPPLMGQIEQSLVDVNTSHRLMSSLQVLTSHASIIFSHEYGIATAGGAPYLLPLLQLCLPGVDVADPIKTSYTMTWLAILFYLLPMVDARDAGADGGEARLPAPESLTPAQRFSLESQCPTEDSYAEAVESARTSTMQFEEWSLAYVDTLVKLLRSTDKFAKRDQVDQAFALLLYKNTRAFFSALSPKIYALVCDKLVQLVTSQHFPAAQKQYGILMHTLSLASPKRLLATLLPPVFKRLMPTGAKGGLSTALAESEVEWYLYLLAQAVKQAGGAAPCADATAAGLPSNTLLPYVDSIQAMYDITHNHESKAIRKNSGKLLRNLLRGLTSIYPAEWKNMSPVDDWSRISGEGEEAGSKPGKRAPWLHWTKWGTYAPKSEPYDSLPQIDLIWHIPTPEERAAAEKLLTVNMRRPMRWLAAWIDGDEAAMAEAGAAANAAGEEEKKDTSSSGSNAQGKSDSPLERNLWTLISLSRGVQSLLGGIEGEKFSPYRGATEQEDDMAELKQGRCPRIAGERSQPVAPLSPEGIAELLQITPASLQSAPRVSSLRTHLIRLVHHSFVRLRSLSAPGTSLHLQPSTKSQVLLLKFSNRLLTNYGVAPAKIHNHRTQGRYSRMRLRELLSGHRNRLRPMLVQKCYDIHQSRLVDLSHAEQYTKDIHDLLTDLHVAATSDFRKVRGKASRLMIRALRRYPQGIDPTLDAMLAVFRRVEGAAEGKASDEAVLGCMSVLEDYTMARWISRKWDRMHRFLHTFFLYGEQHKDDKVQLRIQSVFNTMFQLLHLQPLTIQPVDANAPLPASCAQLVDAEWVAKRNESIQRVNKQASLIYMQLITFLYQHASGRLQRGDHALAASPSPDDLGGGLDASAATATTAQAATASTVKITHWRYSLMSSAFFFSLSRSYYYHTALSLLDPSQSAPLITWHHYVTFFLKGLTSSLSPMRTISFLALGKLLGTHTLHVRQLLNDAAEKQIPHDVSQLLVNMDTATSTPVDPAASLSKQGSILSFTSIQSSEEQMQTVFYDFLYSGWMGDLYNSVVCKYSNNSTGVADHMLAYTYFTPLSRFAPLKFPYKSTPQAVHAPVTPLEPQTLQAILDFFSVNDGKHLQHLLDHFVLAHPSLAPQNEGHSGGTQSDSGAGEQIAALVRRSVVRSRVFPTTRFNRKSGAFDPVHVQIIRGLIEHFPQLVTNPAGGQEKGILAMVRQLITATDEPDKSCTAAEVMCGITMAIKHFKQEVQEEFQKLLLPLFITALQTVQPDCLDHWGDGLRRIYTNSDPRRMAWLSRALFLEALYELPQQDFIQQNAINANINPNILDMATQAQGAAAGTAAAALEPVVAALKLDSSSATAPSPTPSPPPGTSIISNESPSLQLKRLRFLLPVLIEVGFRGTKLGEWLLTQLKVRGLLASPWKQVRDEVSWILFILSRNEFQLYENHPAASPGGRTTDPSEKLSVLSSPVYLQFLGYVRDQFDAVIQLYQEDKSNPQGSPKLTTSTSSDSVSSTAASDKQLLLQKETAKCFIETVLTWLHATIVCGDQVFVSTFYQSFLPYVLWAQHHPDPEIGAIAKFAGTGAAWINAGGPALSRAGTGMETAPPSPAKGVRALADAGGMPEVRSLSLRDAESKRTALTSPSHVIDHILASLTTTATDPSNSWHVRVAVSQFLHIWLPRHSLALSPEQRRLVESLLVDTLLMDPQIEVRDAAGQAFQSFVASCFPLQLPSAEEMEERARLMAEKVASGMGGAMGEEEEGGGGGTGHIVLKPHPEIERLVKKLRKLVKSSSKKNGGGNGCITAASATSTSKSVDSLALAQRHGAILGLTALVLTHPYDVPSHLPSLLSFLAGYVEDRAQVISGTLRKLFASFTTTHKDEWSTFKNQFTEEQLEELQAMQLAPSYFA